MIWWLLALLVPAQASEGPWTTAASTHNIYVGAMAERFECFETGGSESCMPTPVAQAGMKVFYRTGIGDSTDVALSIPMKSAFAVEPTDSAMFETSTGFGLIEARVRRHLLTSGNLDLAGGVGLRTGALHYASRDRITNLGEGSTDVYATLYFGSMGLALRRFHTTSMDISYVARIPLQADTDVGRIPGDEVRASAVCTLAITSWMGLGVSADGFKRLWGEDLNMSTLNAYGDDRWSALRASQFKVGGRAVFYPGENRPFLQVSAMTTVWAQNNPVDTTQLEIAAGMDLGGQK